MAKHISGREIGIGVVKGSTWRTAVALGASNGIPITAENFGAKAPKFLDDDSLGQSEIQAIYKVQESMSGGSIDGYLRYEYWTLLFALAMGTNSFTDNTNYYTHELTPAANINDDFATVAIQKADSSMTAHEIWEIPSAKIHGFTINGAIGEFTKVSFNIMGNKIETESPTNTVTEIGSLVYSPALTTRTIALMDSNFKMRMNDSGGIALADGDKIYPNSWSLSFNRPMSEEWEASYDDMSEPSQDGFTEVTLELNFDKYNLETFMSSINAAADDADYFQKIDISFTGPECYSGTDYNLLIELPQVKLVSGSADVGGPGKIPHTVSCKCMAASSTPTGMSSASQLYMMFTNLLSADPLA